MKLLRAPLDSETIAHVHRLAEFRHSADGWVFRAVHYHEVSEWHLVMEKVRGRPLNPLLVRAEGALATAGMRDTARRLAGLAGSWLGHFHKWDGGGRPAGYDVESLARLTQAKVDLLCKVGLPEALGNRLGSALDTVPYEKPEVATVHGDSKPSNLMVARNEIIGIDMEAYSRGHPLVDVGSFVTACMLLRTRSLLRWYRPAWGRLLACEFLSAYQRVVGWSTRGLRLQLLKNAVSILVYMSGLSPRTFWRLRGQALMRRVVSDLLESPLPGAESA